MKPSTLLCLLALLACGCGKDPKNAPDAALAAPADDATPSQRSRIDITLRKIERLARELGHPRAFRELPVIVTDDTRYVGDAKGACVQSGGRPRFIIVRPAVLDFERRLPPGAISTSLFPVLLHEIGHCYFSRGHEETQIRSEGYDIQMNLNPGDDTAAERMSSIDASVMAPGKLVIPVVLERYYVAEVMGLVPRRSLEALASLTPARSTPRYVKREERRLSGATAPSTSAERSCRRSGSASTCRH